jgi:tetratricopeptide (TPR) repeat protein
MSITDSYRQVGAALDNNRGIARSAEGDQQGAIADYTQAITLNPNHVNAYYNRATARANLGDKKGATEDYQKAADLYQQQGMTSSYRDALNQIKKLR